MIHKNVLSYLVYIDDYTIPVDIDALADRTMCFTFYWEEQNECVLWDDHIIIYLNEELAKQSADMLQTSQAHKGIIKIKSNLWGEIFSSAKRCEARILLNPTLKLLK